MHEHKLQHTYCAALRLEAHMPAGRCSNPAVHAQRYGSRWATSGVVWPRGHEHDGFCRRQAFASQQASQHRRQFPRIAWLAPDLYGHSLTSHLRTGACTQVLALGRACMQRRIQNAVQNTGGNIRTLPAP